MSSVFYLTVVTLLKWLTVKYLRNGFAIEGITGFILFRIVSHILLYYNIFRNSQILWFAVVINLVGTVTATITSRAESYSK